MASATVLRRGDVVRVRLDPTEGSEQGGLRPALVLSPELINEHCPVVLVAPLTSQKTERVYPFEAVVEPPDGGLSRRSKILLMHTRAVDKRRIRFRYGRVGGETMRRAEAALKVAAGLVPV